MGLPEKMNAKQRQLAGTMEMLGIDENHPSYQDFVAQINALADPTKQQKTIAAANSERVVREAETVLRHLYYPQSSTPRKCKQCKREFLANYVYVKHCSNDCLQLSIKEMGIEWDPLKTDDERWNGQPPGIIKPETLVILRKWAKSILDYEDRSESVPVPETLPEPPSAPQKPEEVEFDWLL